MYDQDDLQSTFGVTPHVNTAPIPVLKPASKSKIAAAHVLKEFESEFKDMDLSFTAHEFAITREAFFNRILLPLNRSKLEKYPEEGTPEWTQLISEINQTRTAINQASVVGEVVPPFELIAKAGGIVVRDLIAFVSDKATKSLSKMASQLETSKVNLKNGLAYVKANLEILPPTARAAVLSNILVSDSTFDTIEALQKQQIEMQQKHNQNALEIFEKEMKQLRLQGLLPQGSSYFPPKDSGTIED